MSADADAPPLRILDLWSIVRRQAKSAVIAAVLVGLVMAVLPSVVMPPLYRAEATLATDRGLKPLSFQSDPVAGLIPDQMVNSQRELLMSPTVLESALTLSGLMGNASYARSPDPGALLRKRLRTSIPKNSWIIVVSLDDEDPIRAEAGLQSIIDAFLANQRTQHRNRQADDLAYITSELDIAAGKLHQARLAESQFREKHVIASIDPDRNHITARIQTLAERQAVVDERVAASGALLKQVLAADAIEDRQQRLAAYLRIDTISTLTVVGTLQKSLHDLLGTEAELSAKYLDRHPRMIEIRSHIAEKRSQLEDTLAAARAAITADHEVLVSQRTALIAAQQELMRDLNTYREHIIGLKQLELQTQAQQKVHDELLARRAQLTALNSYDDQRMVVTGPPRSSTLPRGLSTAPMLLIAIMSAITAAVATAALADGFDRTVRDVGHLHAAHGIRQLASLPLVPELRPLCATGPADPPALTEALRSAWTALRFSLDGRETGLVILVASPCPGDGRSTVATRLAAVMATSGVRTLLVDGDMRRPALDAQCGIQQANGLAQLLSGEPELTPVQTAVPNLDLMAVGARPANPGDLLNSHCLPEWLQHVRQHYQVAVVDSPALADSSDSLTLAGVADGVVIVVRAGATTRTALASATEVLTPVRSKILGTLLIKGA
jgi:succinoglycan biosynthesis transport protein ExoP